MQSKFTKGAGLIGLGVGVLLILIGFFVTPSFVTDHFSFASIYYSEPNILKEKGIQAIQALRLSVVCIGTLFTASGALNLICPSKVKRLFDFVSCQGERFQTRHFYLPFCFVCSLIALMFGLLVTQSGSGWTPDSINYILAAENIYSGNGFGEFFHHPLYPLSIAGFMHLGFDAEQAARLIPVLCFALLIFPLFFLGKTTNNVFTGYIACLMCLVFTPLLWVASYAWTDMPYILFSVLAILFLVKFAKNNEANIKILGVSAFFVAVAIVTRNVGVTLVLLGLIVIIVKNGSRLKRALSQTLLFFAISCSLPILWMCRNLAVSSRVAAGFTPSSQGLVEGALGYAQWIVVAIPSDFFSPIVELWPLIVSTDLIARSPLALNPWLYIGLAFMVTCFILLAVYATIYSTDKKVLLKYLKGNYIVISYIFIYLFALIGAGGLWFMYYSRNYLCPLYPCVILVGVSFFLYAYRYISKPSLKPTLFFVITVLFISFFALHSINSLVFYQSFAKDGQGLNDPFWRNSQAIAWVASELPDDAIVYSNHPFGIRLRIENPVRSFPYSGNAEATCEKLKSEENSFVLGFKEKSRTAHTLYSVITEINQEYNVLAVVADFPEATIWRVHRQQPPAH